MLTTGVNIKKGGPLTIGARAPEICLSLGVQFTQTTSHIPAPTLYLALAGAVCQHGTGLLVKKVLWLGICSVGSKEDWLSDGVGPPRHRGTPLEAAETAWLPESL